MPTNQVVISGHVGNTPEPRVTARNGIPSTRLAIGQNEVFWVEGERQERTHWFYVICYGRLAEVMVEYLEKGAGVVVTGRLHTRPWRDQEHERESMVTEIIASHIEITRWPRDRQRETPENLANLAHDEPAATEHEARDESAVPF